MKTHPLFSLLLIAFLTVFTACQKDYVCTCTTTNSDGTLLGSSSEIITDTRNQANAQCNEMDSEILGVVTECKI